MKMYICDPSKNRACEKTHCMWVGRGNCCSTVDPNYASSIYEVTNPCPFCGGAVMVEAEIKYEIKLRCPTCKAKFSIKGPVKNAIKVWNEGTVWHALGTKEKRILLEALGGQSDGCEFIQ